MTEINSPITPDDLAAIRAALPAVTTGPAYLNAGSFGPLPQTAIDAVEVEVRYDHGARQRVDHWDRLAALQVEARAALTSLTGASVGQVALMHSTHEGMNVCLWGLGLRPGDNVITTDEEHPGLLVPLRHVRDRLGCEVRFSHWADNDDAFVDAVMAKVDERTRAVALSHVSWLSGRTAPLRALCDVLPGHVRLIVDGAQSAGMLTVAPSDGWDAYSVSGQKWPCGPNGTGGLALVDPDAWEPTYGALGQVSDPSDSWDGPLKRDASRFEMSQETLPPLAGFAAGVGWLVTEVGVSRALEHARALNLRARELLALQADGRALLAATGDAHLLCVDVGDGRGRDVAISLLEAGAFVRPVGTDHVRISIGCWTTPAEIDGCIAALADASLR